MAESTEDIGDYFEEADEPVLQKPKKKLSEKQLATLKKGQDALREKQNRRKKHPQN